MMPIDLSMKIAQLSFLDLSSCTTALTINYVALYVPVLTRCAIRTFA
jgi:hypothetical protein